MPRQTITTSAGSTAPEVPLNGFYPKFLVGDSGCVWMVFAPKSAVLLHQPRGVQPFRNKEVSVGYATTKLKEGRGLRPYHGPITINVA